MIRMNPMHDTKTPAGSVRGEWPKCASEEYIYVKPVDPFKKVVEDLLAYKSKDKKEFCLTINYIPGIACSKFVSLEYGLNEFRKLVDDDQVTALRLEWECPESIEELEQYYTNQ